MHLPCALGRQKDIIVGFHDVLHSVLFTFGSLRVFNTMVFRSNDSTVTLVHTVLFHERGDQSYTVVVDQ